MGEHKLNERKLALYALGTLLALRLILMVAVGHP